MSICHYHRKNILKPEKKNYKREFDFDLCSLKFEPMIFSNFSEQ